MTIPFSSSLIIFLLIDFRRRKQQRKRIKNLWTDSDDDSDKEDVNDSQNTQGVCLNLV